MSFEELYRERCVCLTEIAQAKSGLATQLAVEVGIKEIIFDPVPLDKHSNTVTIVFANGNKLVLKGHGNQYDGPWIEDNCECLSGAEKVKRAIAKLRDFNKGLAKK